MYSEVDCSAGMTWSWSLVFASMKKAHVPLKKFLKQLKYHENLEIIFFYYASCH